MIENAIYIDGRSQSSITTGTQTGKLEAGIYDVWGSADMYIKVSKTTASDVTTGTGYLVRAGQTVPLKIDNNEVIGVTGATLFYHQVGS